MPLSAIEIELTRLKKSSEKTHERGQKTEQKKKKKKGQRGSSALDAAMIC
jgi:hypothetical protein